MITQQQKNVASIMHFSTFSKYFIPFGNIICPLFLWVFYKTNSSFEDENGKRAINFQLSMMLYGFILSVILATTFLVYFTNLFTLNFDFNDIDFDIHSDGFPFSNIPVWMIFTTVVLSLGYLAFDFYVVIRAGLKALEGEVYHYPITVPFIKY